MNSIADFFSKYPETPPDELHEQEFRRSRGKEPQPRVGAKPQPRRRDVSYRRKGRYPVHFDNTPSDDTPFEEPASGANQGTESIRWAQECMNRIFGTQLPLDGVLNTAGRSLLRRFQRQQNLRPTGLFGPDSRRALERACQTAGTAQSTEQEIMNEELGRARRVPMTALTDKRASTWAGKPGLYRLFHGNADKPFYIGETENLYQRLMEHRRCLHIAGRRLSNYSIQALPLNTKTGTTNKAIKAQLKAAQQKDIEKFGLKTDGKDGTLHNTLRSELEMEWAHIFGELNEIGSAAIHPPACRCPACKQGCDAQKTIGRWRRRRQQIVVDL